NVGARHAEQLRKMLDTDDPGRPDEYPCVVAAMYLGTDHHRDVILGVIQHRRSAHHEYVFTYAGFIWTFIVSSHAGRHPMTGAALQCDGSFEMFAFDLLKSEGFKRFATELVDANRDKMDRLYPP